MQCGRRPNWMGTRRPCYTSRREGRTAIQRVCKGCFGLSIRDLIHKTQRSCFSWWREEFLEKVGQLGSVWLCRGLRFGVFPNRIDVDFSSTAICAGTRRRKPRSADTIPRALLMRRGFTDRNRAGGILRVADDTPAGAIGVSQPTQTDNCFYNCTNSDTP